VAVQGLSAYIFYGGEILTERYLEILKIYSSRRSGSINDFVLNAKSHPL